MIGERLLEALNARGVSQAELARRLEATPQTVNRWVNNRVMPGGQSLTQIALILDVRVEYLTGKVDDMGHFGANMELDSAEWKAISALDAPDAITAMTLFLEALQEYHQKPSDFRRRRRGRQSIKDDEDQQ